MILNVYLKIPLIVLFYAIFFDNFILADESFAKVLQSLETSVLVNNKLCGKLFSFLESPATFDKIFKVTSAPVFNPDFNLFVKLQIRQFYVYNVILSHFI